MKKKLLFLITLFSFAIVSAQSVGDTLRVQAFNYDSTTRDTLINFPNNPSLTFEKIILKYNMRCKNALVSTPTDRNLGCGEWDYSCNTFVVDSTKIEKVLFQQPDYIISNFSGSTFNYTSQPTFDHYDFIQKNVVLNNVISENAYALGNGSSQLSHIVPTNQKSGRSQFLIKASDLLASGFSAGSIDALQLNVSNSGGLAKFLKVKIKNSALTSLQAQTIDFTGFTEVYFSDFNFVNGANRVQFYTPFVWDGTSNLVVEISFSNTSNATNIEFLGLNTTEISSLSASNIASIERGVEIERIILLDGKIFTDYSENSAFEFSFQLLEKLIEKFEKTNFDRPDLFSKMKLRFLICDDYKKVIGVDPIPYAIIENKTFNDYALITPDYDHLITKKIYIQFQNFAKKENNPNNYKELKSKFERLMNNASTKDMITIREEINKYKTTSN